MSNQRATPHKPAAERAVNSTPRTFGENGEVGTVDFTTTWGGAVRPDCPSSGSTARVLRLFGHIHPMVPLARALRDRRHDVLWAIPADGVDHVERTGIRAVASGPPRLTRLADIRAR
ncbi:MAG: hypothetical protein M3Y73_14385, partial [Actinomycetota bacterium]|nr:hypothetical protein [Actinomycetota bacterium]